MKVRTCQPCRNPPTKRIAVSCVVVELIEGNTQVPDVVGTSGFNQAARSADTVFLCLMAAPQYCNKYTMAVCPMPLRTSQHCTSCMGAWRANDVRVQYSTVMGSLKCASVLETSCGAKRTDLC